MTLTDAQRDLIRERLARLYPALSVGTDYRLISELVIDPDTDIAVDDTRLQFRVPVDSPPTLEYLLSDECGASLPAPVQTWTTAQLWDSFTAAEQAAFVAAARQSDALDALKLKLTTRRDVLHSSSPELQAALDALVAAGVLTTDRRNQYR